jgi:hypothetical protein
MRKRKKAATATSSEKNRNGAGARGRAKYWSADVTRTSNALDLEAGVFTLTSPEAIARSLKRSAEESHRRKSSPFRSAMSMLTFYINRAGKNLSESQRDTLNRAKGELRKIFGKSE